MSNTAVNTHLPPFVFGFPVSSTDFLCLFFEDFPLLTATAISSVTGKSIKYNLLFQSHTNLWLESDNKTCY